MKMVVRSVVARVIIGACRVVIVGAGSRVVMMVTSNMVVNVLTCRVM